MTAVAVALAVPAAAPAATSCDYSSTSKFLEVQIPTAGDRADLRVSGSGEIRVINSAVTPVACAGGTPTVTNTNTISVFNQAGASNNSVFIVDPGAFGPGATTEAGENGGTPEIEIFINLNDAPGSQLQVISDDAGDDVRFGTSGINPNASPSETQPDDDVFPSNVPSMLALGGDGPDVFGAQGGAGTGGALTAAIRLVGGAGNDMLIGGEGADRITGGEDNDLIFGNGGADLIGPDGSLPSVTDDDDVSGGPGTDRVTYQGGTSGGVTVDLAVDGGQSTGGGGFDVLSGVEELQGSPFADVLRGDAGPNTLLGGFGNDALDGRDGVDVLDGGLDDDELDVRDGGADSASCGAGTDSVTADAPGADTLTECESVLFPAPPGDPPVLGGLLASAPQAPAAASTAAARPPAFGARTLVTLSVVATRIPPGGAIGVLVANDNEFPVSGSLAGRTVDRVSASVRRRVAVGARSFSVGPKARTTVTLRLPDTLRRLLARRGRLALRLTATVRDPAGNARSINRRFSARPNAARRR